ncbi:MAG: hypothetical protein ACKO26_01595, partial [Planctomycetota bacterium]
MVESSLIILKDFKPFESARPGRIIAARRRWIAEFVNTAFLHMLCYKVKHNKQAYALYLHDGTIILSSKVVSGAMPCLLNYVLCLPFGPSQATHKITQHTYTISAQILKHNKAGLWPQW